MNFLPFSDYRIMRRALPKLIISASTNCVMVFALILAEPGSAKAIDSAPSISWKRTIIDSAFRSEGVAVADVDRDDDKDILVGELWYEAPSWLPHEISSVGDYGDGALGYSNSFLCFADDINQDQWPDLIVIGFPGQACHWFENPRGAERHWPRHHIWPSACNESPAYLDLFGNGRRVLLMAWNTDPSDETSGQLAWFEPGQDTKAPWIMHPISDSGTAKSVVPATHRFSHGLGAGDINQDGRLDVVCTEGWWEQPKELSDLAWPFHGVKLGEPCAQMYVDDLNDDGVSDVLTSSAHNYGIWMHRGSKTADERYEFETVSLFPKLVSQTHGLIYEDINGDGRKDLVTGKRWWAHGPDGDPGSKEPATLYWLEAVDSKTDGTNFVPRIIDNESGVGLHLVVEDVNSDGLRDVISANKKGVFLFEQVRKSAER
jgi:hypothetical protein